MSELKHPGKSSQIDMCKEVKEPCSRCGRDIQEVGRGVEIKGRYPRNDKSLCKDCKEDLRDFLELGGD